MDNKFANIMKEIKTKRAQVRLAKRTEINIDMYIVQRESIPRFEQLSKVKQQKVANWAFKMPNILLKTCNWEPEHQTRWAKRVNRLHKVKELRKIKMRAELKRQTGKRMKCREPMSQKANGSSTLEEKKITTEQLEHQARWANSPQEETIIREQEATEEMKFKEYTAEMEKLMHRAAEAKHLKETNAQCKETLDQEDIYLKAERSQLAQMGQQASLNFLRQQERMAKFKHLVHMEVKMKKAQMKQWKVTWPKMAEKQKMIQQPTWAKMAEKPKTTQQDRWAKFVKDEFKLFRES